jgi:hypothetical protein
MNKTTGTTDIQSLIFTFRNKPVMIDKDLAQLYHVETKVLNQTVKRNLNRFPKIFRFQLNDIEKHELVTNCDRFIKLKHSSVNPYAFTEQGVAMLSAVLRSDVAVEVSIQIKLDLAKHNAQYPAIIIKESAQSHDRFLLIDGKELYHIGASLKDLGKKWFAFSRMDSFINDLFAKLK